MPACIVGWKHLKFARRDDRDVEALIVDAAAGALADAGVAPADVDAVYVGTFNGGLVAQDFPASLALQASDDLRFTPATRVENACATGSAAVFAGLNAVAAGGARIVLVIGVEKMSEVPGGDLGPIVARGVYVREEGAAHTSFAEIFGLIAGRYFAAYGDRSDALARIAAKNHRNGCANPMAQIRKDLGYDFCRTESPENPRISGPLRRTDCSPVSDGAAALVLADTATARALGKAVAFRAAQQVNDFLPISRRVLIDFEGPALAWRRAYAQAGIGVDDLDVVETHDCFTIAELIEYEAMGLTRRGEGARAAEEGWTEMGGRLPVNPSGGLKAKGHPIGATGVSMHVLAAMQVTGTAGDMQVPDARLAGIFNMGGAAVASYVSVLEPLR